MRLLSIFPENSLGGRLDDLLASRFALQSMRGAVAHPEELPSRLRSCILSLAPVCAWRAFRAGDGIFCAIARALSGENRASAEGLEAYFLDNNACVYSAALWAYDAAHGWWLDSVLDPSYDCEHGWWLGAVLRPRAPIDLSPAAKPPGAVALRLMHSPPAALEASDAQGARRRKPRGRLPP